MTAARAQLVAQARAAIAAGSKSFAAASLLFDPATRERVHLLYAWCRACDDLADGQDMGGALAARDGQEGERLELIRDLTARAMAGEATGHPAFDALGVVAAECGLTQGMADDVIAGFALDAAGWQPRSEGDLMRYCYHVAGAVGVMMAVVMGVSPQDADTLDRACDLGLAFQLGNILRDVAEDAAADRCYIPAEWLAEMDIPPGQHMHPAHRPALVALAARMADMAQAHESAARIGAARLPWRSRWAVLSAANIYGAIARKVRARGPAAWDARVHTGKGAKLVLVARALRQVFAPPPPVPQMPRWTRAELIAMAQAGG
ncbi:phytoene/squalene synthase family protein [Alteraurantiacibacter palmitatis]|uniref:Phytoene/squalene synthase family protein n=1 Tax=Alteraurantiacibacter palmitatis TaxID=2054628 RepID=A0ABV7E5U9_9SPHN